MNNKININTEQFINELNDVITKNVTKLMNDFGKEHKLFEESHIVVTQLGKLINLNTTTKMNEQQIIIDTYTKQNKILSEDVTTYKLLINHLINRQQNFTTEIDDLKKEFTIFKKESTIIQIIPTQNNIFKDVKIKEEIILEKKNIILEIKEESDFEEEIILEKEKIILEIKEESDSEEEIILEKEEIILEIKEESDSEEEIILEKEEIILEKENIILEIKENIILEIKEDSEEETDSSSSETDSSSSESDSEEELKEEEEEIETETEKETEKEKEEINDSDEEEEYFEIKINNIKYATTNEQNGDIYTLSIDGDVNEKVGYLKKGKPFFILI